MVHKKRSVELYFFPCNIYSIEKGSDVQGLPDIKKDSYCKIYRITHLWRSFQGIKAEHCGFDVVHVY